MKMTIDLPSRLLQQARARADDQKRSLDDIIVEGVELLFRSIEDSPKPATSRRTKFPIIEGRDSSRVLTSEMVAAAEEEILREEAVSIALRQRAC